MGPEQADGDCPVQRTCRALVRPLLEFGAQFWSPIRRVDAERLEKVQARATKLVPSIRNKGISEKTS